MNAALSQPLPDARLLSADTSPQVTRPAMTADELVDILYAAEWSQVQLADYLVRHPRTVRRWLHGETPIPEIIANAVRNTPRLVAFDLWLQTVRGERG